MKKTFFWSVLIAALLPVVALAQSSKMTVNSAGTLIDPANGFALTSSQTITNAGKLIQSGDSTISGVMKVTNTASNVVRNSGLTQTGTTNRYAFGNGYVNGGISSISGSVSGTISFSLLPGRCDVLVIGDSTFDHTYSNSGYYSSFAEEMMTMPGFIGRGNLYNYSWAAGSMGGGKAGVTWQQILTTYSPAITGIPCLLVNGFPGPNDAGNYTTATMTSSLTSLLTFAKSQGYIIMQTTAPFTAFHLYGSTDYFERIEVNNYIRSQTCRKLYDFLLDRDAVIPNHTSTYYSDGTHPLAPYDSVLATEADRLVRGVAPAIISPTSDFYTGGLTNGTISWVQAKYSLILGTADLTASSPYRMVIDSSNAGALTVGYSGYSGHSWWRAKEIGNNYEDATDMGIAVFHNVKIKATSSASQLMFPCFTGTDGYNNGVHVGLIHNGGGIMGGAIWADSANKGSTLTQSFTTLDLFAGGAAWSTGSLLDPNGNTYTLSRLHLATGVASEFNPISSTNGFVVTTAKSSSGWNNRVHGIFGIDGIMSIGTANDGIHFGRGNYNGWYIDARAFNGNAITSMSGVIWEPLTITGGQISTISTALRIADRVYIEGNTGALKTSAIGYGVTATSSAITLTATSSRMLSFTGSSPTTWTLSAISAFPGQEFLVKNRGSATLTIVRQGSDELYGSAATTSQTITAGSSYIFVNDGTYWIVN